MADCPKYTLLVRNIENLASEDLLENLKGMYDVICNGDLIADIVLDLNDLKLYHNYNEELICELNDYSEIGKLLSQEIISKIKNADFDEEFGIQMLGGSKDVFNNLCINYYKEYKDSSNIITTLMEASENDKLHKVLHKIKGVSFYVGGEKFYKLTCQVETKVLCGEATINDLKYFNKYHERILNYLLEKVKNV